MRNFETAQAVAVRAQAQPPGALAKPLSLGEVGFGGEVGLVVDVDVGIGGEALAGGLQQAFVARGFGQQALDQLQAERQRVPDQL